MALLFTKNQRSLKSKSCAKKSSRQHKQPRIGRNTSHDISVEHDPGRRPENLTDDQVDYLTRIGPCQPKLSSYPKNTDLANKGKQCSFSQFGIRITHTSNTVNRKTKHTATFAAFFSEVWDVRRAIQHGLLELMIGRK